MKVFEALDTGVKLAAQNGVGIVNRLAGFLPKIYSKAGLQRKTNHSLKATCVTRMFNEGVPEEVIMKKVAIAALKECGGTSDHQNKCSKTQT